MIGPAEKKDRAELERLYLSCFDDPPGFARAVFDEIFEPSETVTARSEGRIVSMALLPRLTLSDGSCAGYVYAACTAADMRGRGLMGRVMNFALEYMRARGDSLAMLVPAEKSLFDYYAGLGFETAFFKVEYPPLNERLRKASKDDLPELTGLCREQSLGTGVVWDEAGIERLERLYSACGGGFYIGEGEYALFDGQRVVQGRFGRKTDIPRGMVKYFGRAPAELWPGVLFD